jgi:indole-3-glycerol phosphate synthase
MPNTLLEIMAHKRLEIEALRHLPQVDNSALPYESRDFLQPLAGPGINLITEIKPRSPSRGILKAEVNLAELLNAYNRYAAAISVLTDSKFFGGSLERLSAVKALSPHPVLCKDFILDACQLHQARAAGADAVLLIVKVLNNHLLRRLYDLTSKLGMTAVVEIQNEIELERALTLSPNVLLINNRNLTTMETDLNTTVALAPSIPKDVTIISASGVSKREHIDRLLPYCRNFLIGSALMLAESPQVKLEELIGK